MSANGFSIAENQVRVFRVGLNRPASERGRLHSLLSADERYRASRFRFSEHRYRYVAARASLRLILGLCLNATPEALRFEYLPNGKPYLASRDVRFNLSHSSDVALVAVNRNREIGVDVERIRNDQDLLEVAEHYFAPSERRALLSLPESDRSLGFFRCWTRKEAYLKARGDGLAMDLHSFSVGLHPGEPAALLESAEGPAELARWKLCELDTAPGFAAALAIEGPAVPRIHQQEFAA